MKIQESGEMYLETILILSKKGGSVRAIDVADQMGYSKPSVSRALAVLREAGMITTTDSGSLLLTEQGHARASKIYARHTALTTFLIDLGVSPKTAEEDACRIEHIISDETYEAFCRQVEKLENNG